MKLSQIIIYTMLSLTLLPPLFADGAIFSSSAFVENACGEIVKVDGIYFDNVYYPILYFLLAFIALAIPYIDTKMSKLYKNIATMYGAWMFSGFVFELINITRPTEVINTQHDPQAYYQWILAIALGYIFLNLKQKWHQMN